MPQSRQQIDDKQPLERLPVDRVQEGGSLRFVQRANLLTLHARQLAGIGRIDPQIADLDGLSQRPVQNAVNIFDSLCRKRLAPARAALEVVKHFLDLWCFERLQLDSAERGLDRAFHLVLVGRAGQRLQIDRVFGEPDIKPVGHGQFRRLLIGRVVDRHGCGLHLLTDFFLRLAGEAAADLLAGAGIDTDCQP